MSTTAPSPDPRVGLRAGLMNAEEATWNLRVVSKTPPVGPVRRDHQLRPGLHRQLRHPGQLQRVPGLGHRRPAEAGAQDGLRLPGLAERRLGLPEPALRLGRGPLRPARLRHQGVTDTVSTERLRGIRIFDITDITHPRNVGNVQTCRGSHTHTVLVDPKDTENVYVYISGSSQVRSSEELPGCVQRCRKDPNSALFRIEVIKVPLAHPGAGRDRELAPDLPRPGGAAEARRGAGGHRRQQEGARRGHARGRIHRRDRQQRKW